MTCILSVACQHKNTFKKPTVIFTLEEKYLPAYEKEIDHRGLISDVYNNQEESFNRGKKIYNQVCITCHGNQSQEGSIPSAFKFWKDKFKVGKDPYSIYQTLTRGYGGMPAQMQLTPVEKYDVINYVREAFVLKENKTEYFKSRLHLSIKCSIRQDQRTCSKSSETMGGYGLWELFDQYL